MSHWQNLLRERLATALPVSRVEVYGSLEDDVDVDGWSDLDIRLRLSEPAAADTLFDARLWAWQEHHDGASQTLRLVFEDGRRVDTVVVGHPLTTPDPAQDNDVRFDAALAATRLGRGNTVIGLHLCAGILRNALELALQLADRETGSSHHRTETRHDVEMRAAWMNLTETAPTPKLVITLCEIYTTYRSTLESGYTADWSGLEAVIDRGERK